MSGKIYIDAAYKSLNKYTEVLCGDRVEVVKSDSSYIVVLSDGLGSGVKANILSTLTSKIISTMMTEGESLEATVETIAHTLPVCSVRKVAYSTFSILQIDSEKNVYLVEFDSPACICIRDGRLMNIEYNERIIAEKVIRESRFKAQTDDLYMLISDGVIYAGIGAQLRLGWGWNNASSYAVENYSVGLSTARMSNLMAEKCSELYFGKPGDDTTIATVKIVPKMEVSLFSGPPQNPANDSRLITEFMIPEGKKVVCGGSSATIASRILGQEIEASIDYLDPEIPPIGKISGIDLVTEGVLTLKKTVSIIKDYYENPTSELNISQLDAEHGAARLAKLLVEECTHLHLFIGKRINPAHQDTSELSIKMLVLDELYKIMTQAGKVVTRKFF